MKLLASRIVKNNFLLIKVFWYGSPERIIYPIILFLSFHAKDFWKTEGSLETVLFNERVSSLEP